MPDPEKKDNAKPVSDAPPLGKNGLPKSPAAPAEPPKDVPPDLVPVPDDGDDPSDDGKKIEEASAETAPEANPEANDELTPFDDEKTDKAINEIIAKEGDDILALQDAGSSKGGIKPPKHRGAFGRFVRSRWTRSILLLIVLGGITAVAVMPKTRYLALNTAGVTSSSSLTIVDSTTELPLKGVSVSLAGHEVETDKDGKAQFANLKLGPTTLHITQVGFETISKNIVVGWGSNPLGSFALKSTGVQYVVEVTDYLSGRPLAGVEATDGEVTALSDKKGKITITLPSTVVVKEGITLSRAGYRDQKITLNENPKKATKATMVLARKAVFVERQSGKYSVYTSDLDGQNRAVLLAGTGHENSNIALAVSPDGKRVALVSTRDNKRDSSGFLLSSLVLVNVDDGTPLTIAQAAQIQLIDWTGQRIIYRLSASSGASGKRYTLASYNYTNNARLQLATANSLGAIISAQGSIYYAIASDASNPSQETGLFSVKPDGSGNKRLVDGVFSTVLRSTYDTLSLQTEEGKWYAYDLPEAAQTEIDAPDSLTSRLYVDNASQTRSLWMQQGTLKSYKLTDRKDTDVDAPDGLAYPVQWLSDTVIIYRLSTGNQTADYAISLEGGKARKIADVSPTYGYAQVQ
jgi:hypothetical protein